MNEFFTIAAFPVALTLTAFRLGQLCQKKFKLPIFNPILIAMALVVAFSLATGMSISRYKLGMNTISWLMTPATICMAIPMYQQFQILKKSLPAIAAGVAAGAVTCLVFMLVACPLLGLDRSLTVSLMPKSVTTAIGVPLSDMYGGLGAVTTACIIITGVIANMMGTSFCKWFKITDEVAQGVAFGTAGHVIGTAKANELSELIGAVSSLSLVVAGLLTAVLFPIAVNFL